MKVLIEWDSAEDELYTYWGACPCGNKHVIINANYCSDCGAEVKNKLSYLQTVEMRVSGAYQRWKELEQAVAEQEKRGSVNKWTIDRCEEASSNYSALAKQLQSLKQTEQ